MPQSSVNIKGQITLPQAYRKQFGIHPKDIVTITNTADAIIVRKAKNLFELEGALGTAGSSEDERTAAMEASARHTLGED